MTKLEAIQANKRANNRLKLVSDAALRIVSGRDTIFIRCANTLFSDEDIAELQGVLLENPAAGDRISGGRGLRKLRVPLPGRGKSGGARVIYYHCVSEAQCYLVYAYAKNVAANLTKAQLQRLADLIDTEVKHG